MLIEAQNRFVLAGKSGITVAGQPDLVRLDVGIPLITDCKTGQPMDAHVGQVMCYMLLLPYTRPEYLGLKFAGRLQYQDYVLDIPPSAIDEEFKGQFRQLMAVVADNHAPDATPSMWECRYCPITSHDCPQRIEAPESRENSQIEIDLF